jgi:nitrogenase molybdenum-cofactor synthesis protein NifE
VGSGNFVYVKRIAELSPSTKIYSNLSPSMISYQETDIPDIIIGQDAMYYHPSVPGLCWNGEAQPFGYAGVTGLFREITECLQGGVK